MIHYTFSAAEIDTATDAALECLAWSTPNWNDRDEFDNPGESLEDHEFSDAARETVRGMVYGFMSDDRVSRLIDLLALYGVPFSPGQIGHDFILTANGHGAGFWDRDYRPRPKAALDALSEIVRPYGEIAAYVSDAGEIEVVA